MADDESKEESPEESKAEENPEEETEAKPEDVKKEEDLDLDEDLADALGDAGEGDGKAESAKDVDGLLNEVAPEFSEQLDKEISSEDFSGVVIEKDKVSEDVEEMVAAPSAFKMFLKNLPKERKNSYISAAMVVMIMIPIAILIFMGKLLPKFEPPYVVSMEKLASEVYTYSTDGVTVPLFDEYRVKSFTYPLPKIMINLRTDNGMAAYAAFEFFLNLRDEENQTIVDEKKSEIIDLIQRVLEQVSWNEMQTPLGKEKVKKVVRHQLNEYMQANVILGVYYRSVLLQK